MPSWNPCCLDCANKEGDLEIGSPLLGPKKQATFSSFLEMDEEDTREKELNRSWCTDRISAKKIPHSFLFIAILGYSLYFEMMGAIAKTHFKPREIWWKFQSCS
jgi:hypothetical protein